jgi:hypothetical protein
MIVATALEEHYTPLQLAKLWGLSADTIRNMFRDEPGVLVINRGERMNKRGYLTIRIPASVAARVHQSYRQRSRSMTTLRAA